MAERIEVFCPTLRADSVAGVIEEMAAALQVAGVVGDGAAFARDVMQREAQHDTWLGREAAIPHARSTEAKELALVIGRHPTGVTWGTPEQVVRLIFLVAVPPTAGGAYLALNQRIVRSVREVRHLQALLTAENKTAFAKTWQATKSVMR